MLIIFWVSWFGKENVIFGRKLVWIYREISVIKSGLGVCRFGCIFYVVNMIFIELYIKVCK